MIVFSGHMSSFLFVYITIATHTAGLSLLYVSSSLCILFFMYPLLHGLRHLIDDIYQIDTTISIIV